MLLRLLSLLLGADCQALHNERQFVERLSMLHPHVAENGRNPFYYLRGDYVVYVQPNANYTQLGYALKNSAGCIVSRAPLQTKSFALEVDFEVSPASRGRGFGFWLADAVEQGEYYGIDKNYSGVGVVIDMQGRPFVRFVDSKNKAKSATVYPNFAAGRCRLTLENCGKQLTISLSVGNTKYTIYNGASRVAKTSVFGITAHTGDSAAPLKFYGIIGYSIARIQNAYVKGETTKNHGVVLLVGACCIAGLIYYVRQKKVKTLDLKN
ncbi:hypothetical protein PAPHI01_0468 [Pancytospora philotis]|nr:hypothetical protein PAPHI01_0468 [Pancytospora philotis]